MKKIATIISLSFIAILPTFGQVYVNGGDYDTNTNTTISCTSFSYNMRKGDRDSNTSNEVSKLQELLGQLGYMYQDPTGFFGNTTFTAVKSFQSANNLSATGYVGTLTRDALRSRSCNTPLTTNNNNTSNTVCALNTTYISNSCVCPVNYFIRYTISGSSAFTCQPYNGVINNNNNGVISCNLNTVYSTNSCVCPSGYTAATYGSGTFMCQSYNGVYNNTNYNNNTSYNDCNYYGNCNYNTNYNNNYNNQYTNIVCAVGDGVTVDLSRCTCPTGYTAVQYQTFAYDGTQTGTCRYQGWYGY